MQFPKPKASLVHDFIIKPHCLKDYIGKVFIIAYREPTQLLENFLTQEGFDWEVLRQEYRPDWQTFSPSYRCLINHQQAWLRVSQSTQPALILEADFVPVVGFGSLPLPFSVDAFETRKTGVAWLYTCASQLYSLSPKGYADGASVSTVAYVIMPAAARSLLELADAIAVDPGPQVYSSWDSQIDSFLRQRQFTNYIPFRNYGEHGGRPNPEHRQHGLSAAHRASVLYGKLAFLPFYASDSRARRLRFILVRLQARCKGLARLIAGRFLRISILRRSKFPLRLINFAIRSQLSLY